MNRETGKSKHLIGSGWKPISMIDVYNSVTFTMWLCGCNLKCPFCHNWRLAINDSNVCHYMDIERLMEELESSRLLIDYLHVTGGEPLIQHKPLSKLFRTVKDAFGVSISLNTNFTLYKPLEFMVKNELVDHLATDLKIPYDLMYGYPSTVADKLWSLYISSIELVADANILLELRVPVAKNISLEKIYKYADQVHKKLEKHGKYYVIVQPLLGPPVTSPRNLSWCKKYCDPDPSLLDNVADIFMKIGYRKVIVRKTLSFG